MLGPRKLSLPSALLAALLLSTSCRTAPVPSPGLAAPPLPGSGRVILISLDGASAVELHRRYEAGELKAGGFARFFEEGQVASSLRPVDPTLTAVNHISLATGFPPSATGIVSNNFHPAGSPWGERVSGFSASIGTETLWEAAKRQGKRAAVWTFPGADDTGPRRRADWGLAYVGKALHPSAQIDLSRASFQPLQTRADLAGLPPHYGPALSARVETGSSNEPGRTLRLIALDRRDDGKEAYEELFLAPISLQGGPSERLVPLASGGWSRINSSDLKLGQTASWAELIELAPDLSRVRLYLGAENANLAYPPDFASALAAQGLVWPGAPDSDALDAAFEGKPGIDLAAWTDQAVRFGDFFLDGLTFAARRPNWDLLLGYVPTIDEGGHELLLEEPRQPGYTPERRDAFAAARLKIWQGADRGLARLLAAVDLKTTTVLIASDHGMTPVFVRIDPNVLLREAGLANLGTDGRVDPVASKALAISNGGVSHIYLAPSLPAAERSKILADLRGRFERLKVQGRNGIDHVFAHDQLGPLGLDHPNSGDLVLFAASGFTFAEKPLPNGALSAPTDVYGMHGHLYAGRKGDRRLAGIYLALGRGIQKKELGEVKNTDVAPRAAAYLGIEPPTRTAPPAGF